MYGNASIMYGDTNIMYGGRVLTKSSYLQKVGPRFLENAVVKPPESNIEMNLKCLQEYRVWMLTRVIGSSEATQISPVFAGFISCTGVKPQRKSTIGHFTPITNPFTKYSNVEELLRVCEIATAEVGQDYVFNTDT